MAPTNIFVPGAPSIGRSRRRIILPVTGGGGGGPVTSSIELASFGAQNAVGAIIAGPSAAYYNGKTYFVFQGSQYDHYIMTYNNSTGAIEGPYWYAKGALIGDAHGTPYIHIETSGPNAGTGHVVGNCHVTALTYAKFTGGDISTIAVQTSPLATCSYPCIRQTSDFKLWLFYRTNGHLSPWAYKTSTDSGVTWSAPTNFLLYGQAANDTAYPYITKDPFSDAFHISWTWQDENNSISNPFNASTIVNRYNIYYFKMTAAGVKTNIAGTALGTFPPTLASSNSECLVLNTQASFKYANVPVVAVDANSVPFLLSNIVSDGSTAIPHNYTALWWNGSAVSSSIITTTDYTLDEYNWEVVSGTLAGGNVVLRAYVTTGGSPGTNGDFDTNQFDRGGNIEEWTSAPGLGSWSKTDTVVTAPDQTHLFNSGALIKDYAAPAKLIYNGWVRDATSSNVASVRLWGPNMLSSTNEPETTAFLNRFSVTPSAALQSEINGMIRVLKATGVWAKLDELCLMGGVDAQSSRLGWKNLFNLTPVGGTAGAGPTWTQAGFTGNGTDSYHNTGILASSLTNFTQNDAGMGLWCSTNAQGAAADCGQAYGTSDVYLRLRDASNLTFGRINQATTLNISNADNTFLTSVFRTGSTAMALRKNAAQIASGAGASAARDSTAGHTLWVGGVNLGTPQFSTRPLGAFFIGGSLTTTQETFLYRVLYGWFRRRQTI
jgi:hypothetical protein